MIKKRILTPLVLLFSSLSMLTGCYQYKKIGHRTGEWKYEDSICLKSNGTFNKMTLPYGWVKLKDGKVYNYQTEKIHGDQIDFKYLNSDGTIGDAIWSAMLRLLWSGDIELMIRNDPTGTYKQTTKFILEKIK